MRDQEWLDELLDDTWDAYFSDVAQENTVRIEFGKRAKRQLGCIKRDRQDPSVTVIVLNGLFRDPAIPRLIPEATLVHELIHYAHGFNSPLEQKQKHPHAGGVIRREYAERGQLKMYLDQKRWLKEHWPRIIAENFAPPRPRQRQKPPFESRPIVRKPFWL